MAHLIEEEEDLLTCFVCFLEYNEKERKPKFLSCSHSVCAKCLEAIWKDLKICCPMCRKETPSSLGVADLPNNVYALYMLKIKPRNVEAKEMEEVLPGKICLTCQVRAKVSCSKSHSIFDTESKRIVQNETEELLNLVENTKICIMEEITKRIEEDSDCRNILVHIKKLENGIIEHLDGNDIRMAELMSVLDNIELWGRQQA